MPDEIMRHQLVNLLVERQAHMTFEDAIRDFPPEHVNTRPSRVPYTFWHLLEHLRICQWDILDYINNPSYQELRFPDDLWPAQAALTDANGWQDTVEQFLADRQQLVDIVRDSRTDLYAQIPHAHQGHNILREILIVADHNAYHIGELAILRQVENLW